MSLVRRQRPFAWLALFAMLLLAFAPTVSRVLIAATASDGVWTEMCTLTGLTWVKLPSQDAVGAPKSADSYGQDCAYCPLLNALTVLVLLAITIFPRVRAGTIRATCSLVRANFPCRTGLGSRGPPVHA